MSSPFRPVCAMGNTLEERLYGEKLHNLHRKKYSSLPGMTIFARISPSFLGLAHLKQLVQVLLCSTSQNVAHCSSTRTINSYIRVLGAETIIMYLVTTAG